MDRLVFSCLVCGFLLGPAQVIADQFNVTVTADFVKDQNYPQAFGVTDASTPVTFEFVIDDTLANVSILAAGQQLDSGVTATFSHDLTFIPKAAIQSWDLTIGTAVFDVSTFQDNDFGNLVDPALIYLNGDIYNATSVSALRLNVGSSNVGYISLGNFSCAANTCIIPVPATGSASDALTGGWGQFANVVVTVTSLTKTPTEQIADLQAEVEEYGINDAILAGVSAKLEAKDGNTEAAKKQLDAFLHYVNAQRGKKITDAQADDLAARVAALKTQL